MTVAGGVTIMPPVSSHWPPDPIDDPQFYHDVTLRRVLAHILDLMIVAMVSIVVHLAIGMLTVMTLGLAAPLHALVAPPIIALAYPILQIASPVSATLGMRLMGLRVWAAHGGRPNGLQAVIHVVCYYGSMAVTGGLICLVPLFNPRRLTVHDMLAGVVVLREV